MKPRTVVLSSFHRVRPRRVLPDRPVHPVSATSRCWWRPNRSHAAPIADYTNLFVPSEFPANTALPPNCITGLDQLKDRAAESIVRQAMNAGEALSADDVVDRRQAGLKWILKPGFIGIAIRATAESSFFGLLEPDLHVKVIGVRKLAGGERRSIILMKNVRVLAIDRAVDLMPVGKERVAVPNVITLEVTDDEAKRLAQEEGALTLAVMSPDDLADRRGEEIDKPAPVPVAKQAVRKRVLVATGPLPRGTELKDLAMLFKEADVPEDQVPDNAITSVSQLTGKEGLRVVKPMKVGEPLSFDYLMLPATELERVLTITEGMTRRTYARKPNGRLHLVETIRMGEEEGETPKK